MSSSANAPFAPYVPRGIRSLDLLEIRDWRVKLYTICQPGLAVEPEYLSRARQLASQTLPMPPGADRYGVAFVTVHRAVLFNQIIIDWWERENELRHRVFKSQPERAGHFDDITGTGEAFCIWELRVISFEREAWLRTVLRNPAGADIDAYLRARLEEDC